MRIDRAESCAAFQSGRHGRIPVSACCFQARIKFHKSGVTTCLCDYTRYQQINPNDRFEFCLYDQFDLFFLGPECDAGIQGLGILRSTWDPGHVRDPNVFRAYNSVARNPSGANHHMPDPTYGDYKANRGIRSGQEASASGTAPCRWIFGPGRVALSWSGCYMHSQGLGIPRSTMGSWAFPGPHSFHAYPSLARNPSGANCWPDTSYGDCKANFAI